MRAVRGLKAALNDSGRFRFKVIPNLQPSPSKALLADGLDLNHRSQRLRWTILSSGEVIGHPSNALRKLTPLLGVVGLAIARRLIQLFPSKSTYLVERHNTVGEETSSRNSEVVHSGDAPTSVVVVSFSTDNDFKVYITPRTR